MRADIRLITVERAITSPDETGARTPKTSASPAPSSTQVGIDHDLSHRTPAQRSSSSPRHVRSLRLLGRCAEVHACNQPSALLIGAYQRRRVKPSPALSVHGGRVTRRSGSPSATRLPPVSLVHYCAVVESAHPDLIAWIEGFKLKANSAGGWQHSLVRRSPTRPEHHCAHQAVREPTRISDSALLPSRPRLPRLPASLNLGDFCAFQLPVGSRPPALRPFPQVAHAAGFSAWPGVPVAR
jgi:hypothetical protein